MQNTATNQTIYNLINELAPFDTQESFDNSGLLIGGMDDEVKRVLIALDATPQVIDEAKKKEIQLLITHHPLMFYAIKGIRTDEYEGALLSKLIGNGLSLMSAHTNLDLTRLSGGAAIARKLGLKNIRQSEDLFIYLGDLPQEMDSRTLGIFIGDTISMRIRCYGALDKVINTLAIAGGAYDTGYSQAILSGAQALLTGEVRYHNAIAASQSNFVLYDGGHYHTEAAMMGELTRYLQKELNQLQYTVQVYLSECHHHSEGYT
ncbi:MAG: Nif3-like dinuclear metal center hexameric protein, partial [Clostridiales bacterium]|nr:Nif3-like dinuclear metal center hexameric protein [Clostridiales bacterium]